MRAENTWNNQRTSNLFTTANSNQVNTENGNDWMIVSA